MAQDKGHGKELDTLTESEIVCDEAGLPMNTSSRQNFPNVTEEVHCVDDLISQIVTTFEKQNSSEANPAQSEKTQDFLKQLKKPSEVLTRIDKINVINYLDEARSNINKSSAAVESNLCETSQRSDIQYATLSNEYIKSNIEEKPKMTKSLNFQDRSQSLSSLGQSRSRKLDEEKNDLTEMDSSKYKRPHLEEIMNKEYRTIQKIEKYVNNLVKEVLAVFEQETHNLKSPKKYKLQEPTEIMKLINLSPITLKNPQRTDESKTATWEQKMPSEKNLEQTNPSSPSDLEQTNLSSVCDSEQTNLSSVCDSEQTNLSSVCDSEQTNLSSVCDSEQTNLSSVCDSEQTNLSSVCDSEQTNLSSACDLEQTIHDSEQTNLPSACDLEQTSLSSICDSEQTNLSSVWNPTDLSSACDLEDTNFSAISYLEQTNVSTVALEHEENTSSDNLEQTNVSPNSLWQDGTSKDLYETTVPLISLGKSNTSAHNLEQAFMSNDSFEQTNTLIKNSQPENSQTGNQTEDSEAKKAARYIKNIVQILMLPKQDSKGILHNIEIITYFIDVIGFLNDQLRLGIITIFLEQRELHRTTSCVHENFVLLEFKGLPDVDVNGIDVRVFGKGLLQDLKSLKIKLSLLFREYNLFRLKFLQNSLKFSSIPFELLIGDVKNSWIVSLAKSAAEKICEEFKNKDELEDMHKDIVAERQRLLGYAEEFNESIATLDQFSEV